jgi:hypothetical protein
MANQQTHRGPHPADQKRFAADAFPALQSAGRPVAELQVQHKALRKF